MKTDRTVDTLLEEINELSAADRAELMQALTPLLADNLGLDDDNEST